jgi:PIN domain nuclease of toxin-antitoxin system
MRLLLDTHVLLWWVGADRKLSKSIRELLASPHNDIAISAASFWEIAIKKTLGRIEIDLEALRDATAADGFDELPVAIRDTLLLDSLPDHHRDPFDRILIAQAIGHGRRLVTREESILTYAGLRGFDPLAV